MENLDFQIISSDNYYANPNSMHLCFPLKIKKTTEKNADIDADMITVNSSFCTLCQRNKRDKVREQ